MSSSRLVILTVSTDDNSLVRNFESTCKRHGYEYHLVGRGQKWGGWKWRTAKYIEAFDEHKIGTEDIVVICDSNDVIMLKGPDDLRERFLNMTRYTGCKVIVSAESICVNGIYLDSDKRKAMNDRMKSLMGLEKFNKTRYKFPNGGFIVGYSRELLSLLDANKDAEDDQNGLLEIWLNDPRRFAMDEEAMLCGNVSFQLPFILRTEDDKKPWMIEQEMWDLKGGEITNKHTGKSPCAIHLPGKNWPMYNKIGNHLQLPAFEAVENPNTTWLADSLKSSPMWWRTNTVNILMISGVLVLMATLLGLAITTFPFWYYDYRDMRKRQRVLHTQ